VHDAGINGLVGHGLLLIVKVMELGLDTLFIVAKFVQQSHLGISAHVGDSINQASSSGQFVIKDGGIPIGHSVSHSVSEKGPRSMYGRPWRILIGIA